MGLDGGDVRGAARDMDDVLQKAGNIAEGSTAVFNKGRVQVQMIDDHCPAEFQVVFAKGADGVVVKLRRLQQVILDRLAAQAATEGGQARDGDPRRVQVRVRDHFEGMIRGRRVDGAWSQLAIGVAAIVAATDGVDQTGAEQVSFFHGETLAAQSKLIQHLI